MRHARSVGWRGAISAGLGLACLLLQSGCTRNYYYGYDPCSPTGTVVMPGSVRAGSICEVPSGSTVVAGGTSAGSESLVVNRSKPPQVVVSEPARGSRNYSWRVADPDGGAVTTRVEGAVESSTITR